MDKTVALCLTALLLLAGCLDSASEDDVEELISIAGCDDETSLNYNDAVTEANDAETNSALCASEELIEQAIVDFITFMNEGPDMDNITSTEGYSMQISEVHEGATWTYVETIMITPTGYSESIEDSYGEEFWTESIVASGSQVQYVTTDSDGNTMQVRMTHALEFSEFFAMMMSEDMDEGDMDEEDMEGRSMEDNGTGQGQNNSEDGEPMNQEDCEANGGEWVTDEMEEDDSTMMEAHCHNDDDNNDDNSPEELMSEVDTDGDNKISLDELQNFLNTEEVGLGDLIDEMSTIFNSSDVNASGYLEMEELEDFIFDVETFFMKMEIVDDRGMVCYNMDTFELTNASTVEDCDDTGGDWVDLNDMPDMDSGMDEDEDPEFEDYTESIDENSITFTGFEVTTTGVIFKGTITLENIVNLGMIEVYTSTDFTITGFKIMDAEEANNWVTFTLITSGDAAAIDEGITQYALPFELMDVTDYSEESEDDSGWSFDRELEDCDMDDDSMVDYQELDICLDMDLGNDGYPAEMLDDTTRNMLFSLSDMDNDSYLNENELMYLNLMLGENDGGNDEPMNQEDCEAEGGEWVTDEMDDNNESVEPNCHFDEGRDAPTPEEAMLADTDGDGNVSWDEFTTEWETNWTEFGNLSEDAELNATLSQLFTDADEDNSSGLNMTEIEYMIEQIGLLLDAKELSMTFAMMDVNQDGEINVTEFVNSMDENMSQDEINGTTLMMSMYDGDNSSSLNFSEFKTMWDNRLTESEMVFNMIDTDGDGQITATEWANVNTAQNMTEQDMENMSMILGMYDVDNSSGLDIYEYELMMSAMDNSDDNWDDEAMTQEDCEAEGGEWMIDEMMDESTMMEPHCHDKHDDFSEEVEEGDDIQVLMVLAYDKVHGDLDDYSLTFAQCDYSETMDEDVCEDVYTVLLSSVALTETQDNSTPVSFMDADSSGTLSTGDLIFIDHNQLDELNLSDWNTPRLLSEDAGRYSDESPMPGFTGVLATIGLLGAALIRRE